MNRADVERRDLARLGTMLAGQRAEVTYLDRRGRAQAGTLVYYPSTGGRPSAGGQARIRTAGGYFVSIPVDRVTLPQPSTLNPQPDGETNPQPSTLKRRSRVSVHELGPDGTLVARDVGAPPGGRSLGSNVVRPRAEGRPPSRQAEGPR